MENIEFKDVVKNPYALNAPVRDDFPGFKEDYLVLYCLIKKYSPQTFFEIGTSSGNGTKIICKAMGFRLFFNKKNKKKIFSIDVPPGTNSKEIYPDAEDGHPKSTGIDCKLPFTQVFGNSLDFDFSPYYPIEGWFIDGKHNYIYTKNDTEQALKSNPKIIVWHDMQMEEVTKAVLEVMNNQNNYKLFRVIDTRIAFAIMVEY